MTLENPFFVVKDEVCKALNKNRGLYGRWSELHNVAVASPTGGMPLSGSATAISRTDELDWTTTELRKALRSIEWDLDDLEDTICIVEKNPTKFKIDNKELTVQRSFIEQAREEVKIMKDKLNLSRSRDRDSTARQHASIRLYIHCDQKTKNISSVSNRHERNRNKKMVEECKM